MLVHRMVFHADKAHMWCAMSISGIIFFFFAMNSHWYVTHSDTIFRTAVSFLENLSHFLNMTAQNLTPQAVLCVMYRVFLVKE